MFNYNLNKLLLIIAICVQFIVKTNQISQDLSTLHEESRYCFKVINDRLSYDSDNYLIALPFQNYTHSMETFINLVEQIEDKWEERGRRLPADYLIKSLLRKFNVDGLKISRRETFEQGSRGKLRNNLIDILLDAGGSTSGQRNDLNAEILTPEQHCTLFYMLSRIVTPLANVQIYHRLSRNSPLNHFDSSRNDGTSGRSGGSNTLNRIIKNYGIDLNDVPSSSHDSLNRNSFAFYEQGVVRLKSSETDAIQLSRVLIGILAGLTNQQQMTLHDVYDKLQKQESINNGRNPNGLNTASLNELRSDKKPIRPIELLTLADLWAMWRPSSYPPTSTSSTSSNAQSRITSAWNSPFCSIYYQLQSPFQFPQTGMTGGASISAGQVLFDGVSPSELRGGLDGLAIGNALSGIRQARISMKLSQILKMYYYGQGIISSAGEASVCHRQEQFEYFLPHLMHSAIQYTQLIDMILSKVYNNEMHAKSIVKKTERDFQSKLSDAASLGDSSSLLNVWCAQKRNQLALLGMDGGSYSPSASGLRSYGASGSVGGGVGGGGVRSASNLEDGYGYNSNSMNGMNDPYADSQIPNYSRLGRNRASSISSSSSSSSLMSSYETNRFECDTPLDFIFIVDTSNQVAQQLSIINRILVLHASMHKGSITVLANRPGIGVNRSSLDVISWREKIREKVICDLQNVFEEKNHNNVINRAEDLINRLDITLNGFKQDQNESLIVAAKTLVLFNFGFVKRDQSQDFYAAKRVLENHHRLVKFLVVGQGERDDLRSLVFNARDSDDQVISDSSELTSMAYKVATDACVSPASIQYPKCWWQVSRNQDVLSYVYVRPHTVEYVAISAEYMHVSEQLWVRFAVQNEHQIRVCMSRSLIQAQDESHDYRDCRDSSQKNEQYIEFKFDQPCYDQSRESCSSIYFAVMGLPGGNPDCFESECSSFDQIKVEVSHYGMYCNSAFNLIKPSLIYLIVIAFTITFLNNRSLF